MTKRALSWGLAGALAGMAALSAAPSLAAPADPPWQVAQYQPPGSIPDAEAPEGGEASNNVIRLNRLESDLRRANGEIEQLQNENQRLETELKRFRDDVEYRLSGNRPAAAAPPLAAAPPPVAAAPPLALKPHAGDAYDPDANPNAAGAPRPLGSTPASAPIANGLEFKKPVGAPLDIGGGRATPPAPQTPTGPLPAPTGGAIIQGSGIDFSDAPRQQYASALEAFKAGQYDVAEAGLKAFLAANAGHKLAPDALFLLGESYLQRSRPREAAEQYLKLSTDFAKSTRAPEGMLRLGQSLALLGNGEQACATFAEVGRRYPNAAASVKKAVERETQKNHC